jgi:ATP-dependent DNA helicase RecG
MKTQEELQDLLDHLISDWENEAVEFKIGNKNTSAGEIGKYFSALANEANLRGLDHAWLVFGVDNKTHGAPGSEYPCDANSLNKSGGLKSQIAEGTNLGMCFAGIHLLPRGANANVIFFEIPSAPQGMAVAWKGFCYGRVGENVIPLGLDKLDTIRSQNRALDWTAQVVEDATIADLDHEAMDLARRKFVDKHDSVTADEVAAWDDGVFLDKLRLVRNGKLTRAALLLLGKAGSASSLFSPYSPQMVWKLVGEESANDIFYPPFLLATTKLYSRIRNVPVRVLPENQMITTEVPKYNQKSVLEAMNNCIAHQDYSRGERIIVTERVDRLTFWNGGSFFEGKPEEYIAGDRTPRRYRNPLLTSAMRELNMIDTMGYGIHSIYVGQAKRYFPLPDYVTTPDSVEMTMYGRVVDVAYSTLLIQKDGDLRLDDVLLLDRVQKGLPIAAAAVRHLRNEGLIEGRVPHLHVSAKIAALTGKEADYIKNRQKPSRHYHSLILDYLEKFHSATRGKIDELLLEEIRGDFTHEQKYQKISNLLSYLRINKKIKNVGTKHDPIWVLFNSDENQDRIQGKTQKEKGDSCQ